MEITLLKQMASKPCFKEEKEYDPDSPEHERDIKEERIDTRDN